MPMMRSRIVPYRCRRGPEEFAATTPPTVAPASFSTGSRPSIWSEPASRSCRSCSFIPAWTRTTWSPGTCSMTSFMRAVLKTRSRPRGGLPRELFVPPPRGETASPSSAANLSSSLVSSTEPGSATKDGWAPSTASSGVASRACSSPTILCRSSRETFFVRVSIVFDPPLEVLREAGLLDRVHAERAGPLAAQARGREDLARVADLVRVEGAPQQLHDVQVVGGEHLGHVLLLVLADAVLPRERAPVFETRVDYVPGKLLGLLGLSGYVVVVEDEGMQITVAGVEDVGDAHPTLLAEVGDLLEYLPEFGARDNGGLDVVVVGDAAHRRERSLATLPEERPLGVVRGHPYLRGVVLLADLQGLFELALNLGLGTVELDDQDGPGLGEARVDRGLDRLYAQGIHHLYGGRDNTRADYSRDRTASLLRVLECREQGSDRLGLAHDPQGDLGSYPQSTLGADERTEELVAGRVGGLAAADVDHRAVGEDDLGAHDVVRGEAVFEAVNAAAVLREVPANGGDDLARRVGGAVVAVVGRLLRDPDVDDAGLDDNPLVRDAHNEDLAHPGENDEDPRLYRQSPAGEPRARAPRHERDALVVARPDDPLHLLRGLGQNHELRDDPVVHEAVALVGAELLALGDDALRPQDRLHRPYEPVSLHVRLLPRGALPSPRPLRGGRENRASPSPFPFYAWIAGRRPPRPGAIPRSSPTASAITRSSRHSIPK